MLKLEYPCRLTAEDDGTFTVSFPDVPDALTCGDTRAEALEMAQDALSVALTFYLEDGQPTPHPSRHGAGEVLVSPDLQIALKAAVAVALRESNNRPTLPTWPACWIRISNPPPASASSTLPIRQKFRPWRRPWTCWASAS